jgi:hypothetical protein
MILKDSLFRIHKNFKTIKNVMIISTLVNDTVYVPKIMFIYRL